MKSKTVLVIDNDAESTRSVSKILESKGFLAFTASSGSVGLTMAKKINPALVLLDISAPDTNGLQICKDIHDISSLSSVPIVLLTSRQERYEPRYKTSYGVVDFLKKPVSQDELVSKVGNIVSGPSGAAPEEQYEAEAVEEDFGAFEVAEEATEVPETAGAKTGELDEVSFEESAPQEDISLKQSEKGGKGTMAKDAKEGKHKDVFDDSFGESEEEDFTKNTGFQSDIMRDAMKSRFSRKGGGGSRKGIIIAVVIALLVIGGGVYAYMFLWPFWPFKKTQPAQPPELSVTAEAPQATAPALPVEKAPPAPMPKTVKPQGKAVFKETLPPPAPPAPPKAQAPKPMPAKHLFSVQVGAFGKRGNAETLLKSFKTKGYDAVLREDSKGGKPIYRVLVGMFKNKQDAIREVNMIKEKEKTPAVLYAE